MSRPTGAIEAVSTVEALWTAVLWRHTGQPLGATAGAADEGVDGIASRVQAVGRRLLRESQGSAT